MIKKLSNIYHDFKTHGGRFCSETECRVHSNSTSIKQKGGEE